MALERDDVAVLQQGRVFHLRHQRCAQVGEKVGVVMVQHFVRFDFEPICRAAKACSQYGSIRSMFSNTSLTPGVPAELLAKRFKLIGSRTPRGFGSIEDARRSCRTQRFRGKSPFDDLHLTLPVSRASGLLEFECEDLQRIVAFPR